MREIKFRAWHHGGGDPRITPRMTYSYPFNVLFWKNVEAEELAAEVMQYTGLKDKNGVEIYEGDIVKKGKNKDEIKWSQYAMSGYDPFDDRFCCWNDVEVIGNIYENPELLKK